MNLRTLSRIGIATIGVLFLSSCIGIKSEVGINKDGSGTIKLEYTISRMVETMGKLDGNADQLPLPVDRADWDRTTARVPGLTLTAFSSTRNEQAVAVKAELAFASTDALMGFLDSTGRSATLSKDKGSNVLVLRLSEGGGPLDPDLERLVKTVFQGYTIDMSFTPPTVPTLSFVNGSLQTIPSSPAGKGSVTQGTARFDAPVADILNLRDPLILKISWKE
jgi:hypothetical protein